MSHATWVHGEGRLGGNPQPEPMVCVRCGALPGEARLSACSEKRGGDGIHHFYGSPGLDHPWRDWSREELISLALYLLLKAEGSLNTAETFGELEAISRSRAVRYSRRLYAEKAAKRARLCDWTLAELEGGHHARE